MAAFITSLALTPGATPLDGVPVFQSTMLKPSNQKSIGFIRNERVFRDELQEPDRCAMLASLVDHGELLWQEFPAEAPEL